MTICGWQACQERASWLVYQPAWGSRPERWQPMCAAHDALYHDAMAKPMPGLDRPAHADDDWRPSLQDHIRLSCIAMRHDEQMKQLPQEWPSLSRPWDHRYTPEQLKQVLWLRKMTWPR